MAIREIITIGHPTLRQRARKVTKFGPELQQLIDDMIETMRAAPGVGLAAPQVNVLERVIVLELPADEEEGRPAELYAFVNPEIVKASREIGRGRGRLSLDPWLSSARCRATSKSSCVGRMPTASPNASRPTTIWRASSSTRLITWMASCSSTG